MYRVANLKLLTSGQVPGGKFRQGSRQVVGRSCPKRFHRELRLLGEGCREGGMFQIKFQAGLGQGP